MKWWPWRKKSYWESKGYEVFIVSGGPTKDVPWFEELLRKGGFKTDERCSVCEGPIEIGRKYVCFRCKDTAKKAREETPCS